MPAVEIEQVSEEEWDRLIAAGSPITLNTALPKKILKKKTTTAQRKPGSTNSDYEVSSSEDSSTEEKTDESEMEETAAAQWDTDCFQQNSRKGFR